MSARNWGISYIFWLLGTSISSAEITLDGTLGSTGPLAGPDFQIPAEIGRRVGGNLFHSFGKFSVATQESATFTGPNSVGNVIGRVTGGEASRIDGMIRNQIPNADLYLINPAGIMFGPEAQLDVQGSFHASTADFVRLGEQGRFDASQPENTVLTAAPPEAFGFLGDSPAPLSIDSSQLEVPEDKTLSIVGGGIDIDSRATITASSGRINLASVAGEGEVIPVQDDLKVSASRGDLMIGNRSTVDTSGQEGGDVYIRAGLFRLDNSKVKAETTGIDQGGVIDIETARLELINGASTDTTTSGLGKGGNTRIKVNQDIVISGESSAGVSRIVSATTGEGDAGDINLEANKLTLENGAGIFANTASSGKGGNIDLFVTGPVKLFGESSTFGEDSEFRKPFRGSFITTSSLDRTNAGGNAGSLVIQSERLDIADGGLISSTSFGGGDGNVVEIKVANEAVISGEDGNHRISKIAVQTGRGSTGNAGNLLLEAAELTINNGAIVSAETFGAGQGGNINIHIAGQFKIAGESDRADRPTPSGIFTPAISTGNSGNISLVAKEIIIKEGTEISADTFGPGNAGEINIQTTGPISLSGVNSVGSGSVIGSRTGRNTPGNSGTIKIDARQLQLTDGAQITTATFGSGDANDIHIQVSENIDISGVNPNNEMFTSAIISETQGAGQGGNLNIWAHIVQIMEGGEISARSVMLDNVSDGENILLGDAGNIEQLHVEDTLRMENGFIRTSTQGADGGNIDISSPGIFLLTDSEITTSVDDDIGEGGNIIIKQPRLMVLGGSNIIANAVEGNGGNIDIVVDQLIRDPVSEIKAESELGIDGDVNIDSPDVNIVGGLSELPAQFSDATRFMPKPCAQRTGADVIQFVFRNYDVLPDSPDAMRVYIPATVSASLRSIQNGGIGSEYIIRNVSKVIFDCEEKL